MMMRIRKKNKTKLQIAKDNTQNAIHEVNTQINTLGGYTKGLHEALTEIQYTFDKIRNVPSEQKIQYEELKKIRLNWKQQVVKIEKDYKNATVKNAGVGTAGAGLGVAVVTMGPTVAMGVATTFGVASTGTAISTLSGAVATNAALAWLGGGALAAGGGGMAAGEAFLGLAGPVGWAMACVSLLASGLIFWKSKIDKNHLENLFIAISERDIQSYKLAIVELQERITRIKNEQSLLNRAINKIQTFGLDYDKMSDQQQYELGTYVNLMNSSTQLLVNPILGLVPKYTVQDFDEYKASIIDEKETKFLNVFKPLIISLANLLYSIELDTKAKKLLWKSLRNNKDFLKSLNFKKRKLKSKVIDLAVDALEFKYKDQLDT